MSRVKKEVKKVEQITKIRIKIRSYDHKIADQSAQKIIEAALRHGAKISGPMPLPTEIHRYSVNRSPFIHKGSGEHFELRIHKRIVEIENPSQKLVDTLSKISLPKGVDIEIKF